MASSVSSDNDDDYDSDVTCGSSDTDDKDSYDSGNSSNDDDTGNDEESEEESDDDDRTSGEKLENVMWCGPKKNLPVLVFRPECNFIKVKRLYATGEKHHLAYKIVRTDCRVIRQLLHKHGFHEVHPNSSDFNLMWIGSHVKPYTLRSFTDFQKINHFPRSYEITRKDRLYKNFQRMQHAKGSRHFDFLPQTFCCPSEYDDLVAAHNKERGTWIVKPVASSRGRGIFLVNSPQNVPLDAAYVACRYLNNPLLIDGFKFDLRLYVAVTSYDPLRIYLYEEGLTRFATVQYQQNNKTIKNTCMHLTNYSLNKKSSDYVKCDDGDIEDYGNKWSLGAMLRYLKKQGKDAKLLLSRIEEAVNKTIICAELPVATACKMFLPYRGNCFELYGFDILVDANLKPWVLEVNLSPSLACEAPIDMKIKSNMCGDLFSLTGFIIQDPVMRRMQQSRRNQDLAASSTLRQQKERIGSAFSRQRPNSAGMMGNKLSRPKSAAASAGPKDSSGLTLEERKIVLESKEEYARRGGWMRTFPSPNSMEKYGSLMESRNSMNQLLHSRLFSDNVDSSSTSPRSKSAHSSLASSRARQCTKMSHGMMQELQEREVEEHLAQLLRKLSTKDNSGERRSLRTKVRNKFPATKRIAPNPRNAVPSKAEVKSEPAPSRAPLAQGKLDARPQTGQSKNSAKQPEPAAAQQTTTTNTAAASQQLQKRPSSSKQNSGVSQSNINGTKGVDKGGGGGGEPTSTTGSSGNWVHGKPPAGPSQGSGGAKIGGSESNAGARMVLEIQKPKGPTKEEIRELVNVPDILDRGGDLSKLQARDAFATYLLRVQQRLLAETSKPPEKLDEIDQHDEQMDLVLRFLKRAASNLQQQFKVIVPSRKLPIHDRRRILAKQLVDFVQIYSKETEEMENMKPKKVVKPHNHHQFEEDEESIEDNRFTHFVGVANENELEELLTTYTKQNKSASIFLGTSTNNPKSVSEMMAQPTSVNSTNQQHHQHHHHNHHHHKQQLQQHQHKHVTNGGPALLHRRSSSTENLHSSNKGGGAAGDIAKDINSNSLAAKHGVHSTKALQHYYAAAGASNTATTGDGHYHHHHHQPHQHPMTSSPSTLSLPKRPHSSTPNAAEARHASSADGAVQVYSARFNRQRPYSAKAGFDSGDGRSSGRPNSAVVYRDSSGGQIAARHFSESSQQAIQEALGRLAKRQAARQYSSSSVQNQNLLTQQYVEQHFGLTNPPQGPVQATPVTGYGSNPVLTSTLGRSSARSRSSSVGHVRSPSQNSITAVAVDAQAGSTVPQRSASNSRVSSAVLNEKGRGGASQEQTGHIRRSSHGGVALNRTHSFTTDTSSKDSSELNGPTNASKTTSSHSLANGLSDDAYSAQIKALQNLTVSNRTPYPNAAGALQHQQEGNNSVPIGGGRQMSGGASRPMSLQEQQQMAYELSQQSKAKHQEKVAQAHTNASALRDAIHRNASASANNNNSSSPSHQPRPPPQSANARKPISAKRLARTTQVEEGPSRSGNSFYTSLKYSNTTGGVTNKHHNGSGSIQAQVIRH
ncbi:tubulin polyglutamylase TTLL5 isoform X2 [Strongylocentrotus purpuratus]|uniref:Tubulin--tyrosine ligase-like protein 5 n=1 Tax=Strongylocentrotus purpuratus TaxID=7668 RepID=A0A7M7PRU8_STRPU|nr:tubulin polyglutamylase TTLL5 isoform X2 [Strongylocentrotus purpuratus]